MTSDGKKDINPVWARVCLAPDKRTIMEKKRIVILFFTLLIYSFYTKTATYIFRGLSLDKIILTISDTEYMQNLYTRLNFIKELQKAELTQTTA